MPFPFAAHKANGTAVFTRCSSFSLKIHLERAFLPAVREFLQIFSRFLSFRRREKYQRRGRFPPFNPYSPKKMKNAKWIENFFLFPTNHEKRKMTGIFPSLFSNTGKILKRRMKSEFSPQSLTRATAGFCQTDNKKAANLFPDLLLSLPPVAVGYSISFTNWDLPKTIALNKDFQMNMLLNYIFFLIFIIIAVYFLNKSLPSVAGLFKSPYAIVCFAKS